jgi:hypothetical protein
VQRIGSSSRQNGCYIRTVTVRIELLKRKSLLVSLRMLVPREIDGELPVKKIF